MAHVEAQIAHGQRESLLRHHGGRASTARTQAHRLLRMGSRHQRSPAHAREVKAVAIATAKLHLPHGEPFPASEAPP
eukprot:1978479-Pleurochrysis_carterae.AAC.1